MKLILLISIISLMLISCSNTSEVNRNPNTDDQKLDYPTNEYQRKIYINELFYKDLELSFDKSLENFKFGSIKPSIGKTSTKKQLEKLKAIKKTSLLSLNQSVNKFNSNFQLPENAACNKLQDTYKKIADGFYIAAEQFSKIEFSEKKIKKNNCNPIYYFFTSKKQECLNTYLATPSFSNALISKARMNIILYLTKIYRSYFLFGVDSKKDTPWSSRYGGINVSYQSCHPNNPRETLIKIDQLHDSMELFLSKNNLINGSSNLGQNIKNLKYISKDYESKIKKNKIAIFAASLVLTELAAIKAASSVIKAMSFSATRLGRIKRVFVDHGTFMAASLAPVAVYYGTKDFIDFLNNKINFESESIEFVEHDHLRKQNINYLIAVLESVNKNKLDIIELRKNYLIKNKNFDQCNHKATIFSDIGFLLDKCQNCHSSIESVKCEE